MLEDELRTIARDMENQMKKPFQGFQDDKATWRAVSTRNYCSCQNQ